MEKKIMLDDKKRIADSFDKMSSRWSQSGYSVNVALLKAPLLYIRRGHLVSMLVKLYPDIKNRRILDCGCGTGDIIKVLDKLGFKKLYGCDLSTEMAAISAKKNPKAHVVACDLDAIHEQKGFEKFDVIILMGVLSYYSDPTEKIVNLTKLLNDGGYLLFSFQNAQSPFQQANIRKINNPDHHSFSLEIFQKLPQLEICKTIHFGYFPHLGRLFKVPFVSYIMALTDQLRGIIFGKRYATSILVCARKTEQQA